MARVFTRGENITKAGSPGAPYAKRKRQPRQRVKNYRRLLRNKGRLRNWMRGAPMMTFGGGGTDKGFLRKPGVYYSDKAARH